MLRLYRGYFCVSTRYQRSLFLVVEWGKGFYPECKVEKSLVSCYSLGMRGEVMVVLLKQAGCREWCSWRWEG
jgi:hypothetical protein